VAEADGLDVSGCALPGAPGVVMGHNARIAWGMTNVMADDADLYVEEIHPEDTRLCRVGDEWAEMEVRREVYKVKGRKDEARDVRSTRHGPVITDTVRGKVCPDLATQALSLKWAAHAPSADFEALYRLSHASTFEEAREGMREYGGSPLNMVVADVDGNIGYAMVGKIPIRRAGKGLLPIDGRPVEENEWEGWVPWSCTRRSQSARGATSRPPTTRSWTIPPPSTSPISGAALPCRSASATIREGEVRPRTWRACRWTSSRSRAGTSSATCWPRRRCHAGARTRSCAMLGAPSWNGTGPARRQRASSIWHVFFAVFMERRLKDHLGEILHRAYMEI
jgi:hypothetical protein